MVRGFSVVTGAALALCIACSPAQEIAVAPAPEESAVARAELDTARRSFEIRKPALWRPVDGSQLARESRSERRDPIPRSAPGEWLRDGASWVHRASSGAHVRVPIDASASVRVTAPGGTWLEFSSRDADRAALEWADGVAVYRGERTAFLRLRAGGLQDFVVVPSAAGGHRLRYDFAVSPSAHAVASGASIVVRDASDRPRLKVSGARVIDAKGRELVADLDLVGCESQPSCELGVRWPSDAVYPVLVDPSWTVLDSLYTTDFVRMGHTAVAVDDGVVIIGGEVGTIAPAGRPGVVKYTVAGKLEAELGPDAPYPLRTRFGVAVARPEGGLLFVSGTDGFNSTGDTFSVDPNLLTATTQDVPNLATPRHGAAAARLGDCIYVIGGIGSESDGVRLCDEATAWQIVTVLPLPPRTRVWGSATPVDVNGTPGLLAVGGNPEILVEKSDARLEALALTWPACPIETPDCKPFAPGAMLHHHAASALESEQVFVSGGISCAGQADSDDGTGFECSAFTETSSSDRTFLYEAAALHAGPMLRAARQQHASAALANGYVLVVGGQNCEAEGSAGAGSAPTKCSSPTTVAEICDPSLDHCEVLELPDDVDLARINPTATALDGGQRVLVAYGQAAPGNHLDPKDQPVALFSLRQLGDGCDHGFECVSGFCSASAGVCCESRCADSTCETCDNTGTCPVCRSSCTRAEDCEDGLTCSADGKCEPLVVEPSADCGCRLVGSARRGAPNVALLSLLLAAGVLRRKRGGPRRKRRCHALVS